MSTVHRSLPVTPYSSAGRRQERAFARSYLRFATLKDFPMNTTPTFRDAAQQAIELRSLYWARRTTGSYVHPRIGSIALSDLT